MILLRGKKLRFAVTLKKYIYIYVTLIEYLGVNKILLNVIPVYLSFSSKQREDK